MKRTAAQKKAAQKRAARRAARVKKQAKLGVWICTKRRGKTTLRRLALRRKGQKKPPKRLHEIDGIPLNCRLSHSAALVRRSVMW